MMRLKVVWLLAALATGMSAVSHASDNYPARPIKVLVGYAPGGAVDMATRIVIDALSKRLGQPMIVENRSGAGGTIAAAQLAEMPADGYTLAVMPSTIYGIDQLLYNARYKYTDFAPIAKVSSYPLVLVVNKDLGVSTLQAFIARLKSRPKDHNYSTSGVGGSPHIAALMLERATGASSVDVPFKGGVEALQAVAAGQVQYSFGTPASILPFAGRVLSLGVTSLTPSKLAPNVPTLTSSGLPGFEVNFWLGLFGPAKLPPEIASKLASAVGEVLEETSVKARLFSAGLEPAERQTPDGFSRQAVSDGKVWLERVQALGLGKK